MSQDQTGAVGAALVKAVMHLTGDDNNAGPRVQTAALLGGGKPRIKPGINADGTIAPAASAVPVPIVKPDFDLLKIDDGALKARAIEVTEAVAERREFSKQALGVVTRLRNQVADYKAIDGWAEDELTLAEIEQLEAQIAKIEAAGGQHLGNAQVFEALKAASTFDDALAVMYTLCEMEAYPGGPGRYHEADKAEWQRAKSMAGQRGAVPLTGTVVLRRSGKEYVFLAFVPNDGTTKKMPTQCAFESEAQKMEKRIAGLTGEKNAKKADQIRGDATVADFPYHLVAKRETIPEGRYRLEVPAAYKREDIHRKGRPVSPGGILLVEVKKHRDSYGLTFVDGTGQADAFLTEGQAKKYRGETAEGKKIRVVLSLAMGQILTGNDKFQVPKIYADDEGREAVALYRALLRRAIFPKLGELREAGVGPVDKTAPAVEQVPGGTALGPVAMTEEQVVADGEATLPQAVAPASVEAIADSLAGHTADETAPVATAAGEVAVENREHEPQQ